MNSFLALPRKQIPLRITACGAPSSAAPPMLDHFSFAAPTVWSDARKHGEATFAETNICQLNSLQMRKHFKIVIVAVIAASVLACLAIIISGVNRSAWTLNAEQNIHGAEVIVQTYRREYGASPKLLKEAFDWVDFPFKTNVINLGGCPNSHYEYQVVSNRFSIAIVRKSAWLRSEWKVEQKFEFDTPAKAP